MVLLRVCGRCACGCYGVARPNRSNRPYVFLNMVASVDGGTVVAGKSGGLGSAGDRRIFFLLRSLADGILVGASQVQFESSAACIVTPVADVRSVRSNGAPALSKGTGHRWRLNKPSGRWPI